MDNNFAHNLNSQVSVDLSVIIPAKNEAKRLPVFMERLLDYAKKSSLKYEIIVVDDGSEDNTREVANSFSSELVSVRVLRLPRNRGKGYAVKSGLFAAQGKVVLFMDADGSTGPEEIEKNLHWLDQGFDIVIGSRVLADSQHVVKVKPHRKMIGRVFNFLVHVFLFKDIEDTQCGFKIFKKRVIRPLFARLNLDGFGFDLEVLYLAHKMNFRVKEVPVNWRHVDASKINLVTDSLKMFLNILQIRLWHPIKINQQNQHMSSIEIERMAEMEKVHWWFQSKNELVRHLIKEMNRNSLKILDAGCGSGLNLSYLKDFGTGFGCDVGWEALSQCRRNGLQSLAQCNLEELCYKDRQFDLITVLDVIEHTEYPEKVLNQLKRVLKDDGVFVLTVPAFKFLWSEHDEALSHLRRFQKKELQEMLTGSGFKVERIGYFFSTLFLGVAVIRFCKNFFPARGEFKSDTYQAPPLWLNALLKKIFHFELKVSSFLPLPFGTTLYATFKKE